MSNGITLIALVITIIVLLILAGVSISLLTGENGILSQATKAKEETRGASVEEAKDLWKYEQTLDDATNSSTAKTLDELLQELKSQGLLTDEEVATIKETGEITIGSKTIVFGTSADTLVAMFQNAQTAGCTNEDGSCKDETHLHIGDYVSFQNPTSGKFDITSDMSGIDAVQTYSAANNQDLNWRVLGVEDGKIKLISGSPMKLDNISGKDDPYLYLYGAWAYEYGPNAMNKAVETIYGSLSNVEEARSVNMGDIDQALEITTDEQRKQYNAMAASGIIQYKEQYGPFENQYTPASYLNGKTMTTVQGEVTAYCYFIGDEEGMIKASNNRLNSMLFDNVEYEQGKAYWLSSRGAYADTDDSYANFGPFAVYGGEGVVRAGFGGDTFYSNDNSSDYFYAVRPVVILKSDVTSDEIKRIDDKTENSWNYSGGNWEVDVLYK